MGGKGGGTGKRGAVKSSKGKAIVEFSSPHEAAMAMQALNGQELDSRSLKVEEFKTYANSKPVKGQQSSKVYVSNLAYQTRDWKLKEFFAQAGTATHTRVLRTH